jgi:hypothetical protein
LGKIQVVGYFINKEMIMDKPHYLIRALFPLVAILIMSLTGCSSNTAQPSTDANTNPDPTMLSADETIDQATNVATAEENSIPISTEPGTTRETPIPLNTLISIPGWDIQVLEFLRGEDALSVINTTDWQAQPLPEGQEYALAKVYLKCTALDDDYHSLGISEMFITGSSNVAYGDTIDGWPQPEFLFEDMFTADAVEGWIDAVIPADEQNMMMVVDVDEDNNRYTRYFALEDGASISLPAELVDLNPNELGVNASDPAPVGQQVITPDWEVTVLKTVQGQEASSILETDNPNYSPPSEGMEYLLLQVELYYISENDVPAWVSGDIFYPMDATTNFPVEVDSIYLNGQSDWVRLSGNILPGAVFQSWVPLTIPTEAENIIIVFDPDRYTSPRTEEDLRYLAFK